MRRSRILALCGALFLLLAGASAQVTSICSTSSPSPCVTLSGKLTGANGLPAQNYSITFKPTQYLVVAGSGSVVPVSTTCATDNSGNVVGVQNPQGAPVANSNLVGTLPPNVYYIEYTYVDYLSHETQPSSETIVQVNSTGGITVQAPQSPLPLGVLSFNVYIGITSGSETKQGSVTGSQSYSQSIPLVSGAALPTTNSTLCQQVANDAAWPSGTGYNVALTDTDGSSLPGYPMQWQLTGAGTTINLSNGLPYYHGVVYYPSPILATPTNRQSQSINGSLAVSGSLSSPQFTTGSVSGSYYVDGVTNASVNAAINRCLSDQATTLASIINGVTTGKPYGTCTIHAEASGAFGAGVGGADVIGSFDPAIYCVGVSPHAVCSVPPRCTFGLQPNDSCIVVPMDIRLGGYSDYTLGTAIVRDGFHLGGVYGNTSNAISSGTVITSSLDAPAFLWVPTQGKFTNGVDIGNFTLRPFSGATTNSIGFNFDVGTTDDSGGVATSTTLQKFILHDMSIGPGFQGFPGGDIRLVGDPDASSPIIQRFSIERVIAQKVYGGMQALYVAGAVGNFTIEKNYFDGNNTLTGLGCEAAGYESVYFGQNGSGHSQFPSQFEFRRNAVENSSVLIKFAGVTDAVIANNDFEGCGGPAGTTSSGIQFTTPAGAANQFVHITDNDFEAVGLGAGGYIFDLSTANQGVNADHGGNHWGPQPTNVIKGPVSPNGQLFTQSKRDYPSTQASGTIQATQNITQSLFATTNTANSLVVPGPVPLSIVAGAGAITGLSTSALPEGQPFALRMGGQGATFWAVNQSASAVSGTAYNCTIAGNTQCTLTLRNNLPNPNGGTVFVLGANFTGTCVAFNVASMQLFAATPTTITVPVEGGLAGTSSTCGTGGGAFKLISNLHLGRLNSLTPSGTESPVFNWNEQAGFYECSNCALMGGKMSGPLNVSSSTQISGFDGVNFVALASLTLPDGNAGVCWQQAQAPGVVAYDAFSGQPTFGATMDCTEYPTGVPTRSFWMTDSATLTGGAVIGGTYTSGGAITGSTSQTCTLTAFNNGSSATATVALTGVNTIAGGTALVITAAGTGASAAPTSATLGSGTATCSGTAVISTGLGSSAGVTPTYTPISGHSWVAAGASAWNSGAPNWTFPLIGTTANCAVNSVSPAACGSAASGAVVIPTTTTTYTVNTTAVTANSTIQLTPRTYTGNLPSAPTCVAPAITGEPVVSAIVAGTSFTITLTSTTGQTCWNYLVVN